MSDPESGATDSIPADATPAAAARAPQSIWGAVGGLLQAQRQSAPLRRAPRNQPLPLSEAQQRLWFIQQTDPESVTYQLNTAWRLTGPLNIAAFNRSLDAFVQRHEIYRTTFAAEDGLPTQVIHEPWTLAVPLVDLEPLPADQRKAEYERRSAVELRVPFDLARLPLVRATIYRFSETEHVLLWRVHHIVFDGWSRIIFCREVEAFYQAFLAGQPVRLPELPVQYADYAAWQTEWLASDQLESQMAYWRRQLAGRLPVLELPTDHPRPSVLSSRGAYVHFSFSGEVLTALAALKKQEGATSFVILLAVYQTLLHRYTGQDDLVVGVPTAGRNRSELRNLSGFFVNTQVFRGRVSGTMTFRELLTQVKEVSLAAYTHQDVSFERLMQELRPERDRSHGALFQVMFAFINMPRGNLGLPGVRSTSREENAGTAKFDLSMEMIEWPDAIQGFIEYSTDLFEEATIRRLLGHFETLLTAAAAQPERRLCDLPLLAPAERQQLLVNWNDTRRDYPRDWCVHELFAAQAARTPDAVAVEMGDQRLTYGELDVRTSRLARHLQQHGVGPDALVALCVERSVAMVVGVLGILKAGGAYVPLDPSYPNDRLAYMLADSRAQVLLTQQSLAPGLPAPAGTTLCLDLLNLDTGPVEVRGVVSPESRAYVIYTSGSTGKPKGVQISHRAVVNFLTSMRERPGLREHDVLLSVTTLSFDIAGLELYLPLTTGARLIVVSRETAADGPRLLAELQRTRATVLQATPATWRLLLESGWTETPGLKILCGGEAMAPELAAQLVTRCGALWNLYGPTETTIWSTLEQVTSGRGPILIGRPIANTQVYLLDAQLMPVPIGVPGNLYLAGEGLARGYLNRPELTAEKFIPDPFSAVPGARMYLTGDLARYRADGALECLGRNDHQVKVRGYRIELGEIESVLARHPDVRQAVVVAREDRPGDKRLIAYVVAQPGVTPAPGALREFVHTSLADYMVPAAFVALDKLPLTPNGKVDRLSLPAPEARPPAADQSFVAPRTAVETELAKIWGELLTLPRVSVHDNFFDLGGHSLLALRLFSRIHSVLGVQLSVRVLFEAPTIAELAARLAAAPTSFTPPAEPSKPIWAFLTPIQPLGRRPPFYLAPGGFGGAQEFLVYARLARHLGVDQPFYGLKARGADGRQAPHPTVEEMAADYVREIRAFQPAGPYLIVGECLGGIIAFEMARQLELAGEAVGMLVLLDSLCPSPLGYLRWRWYRFWEKFGPRLQTSLPVRLFHHLCVLPRIKAGERWNYIRGKSQMALTRLHVAPPKPATAADTGFIAPPSTPDQGVANYQAVLVRYRPKSYSGKIDLIVSDGMRFKGLVLAWTRHVRGGHAIHQVPGDHMTYIREHVREAADKLRLCLERATSTNDKR